MARECNVCGKGPRTANLVSHAKNRTGRWLYPNVHRMRYTLTKENTGRVYQSKVCTKCVKAKLVIKVV